MGPSNAFQACIMKPFEALQELPRKPFIASQEPLSRGGAFKASQEYIQSFSGSLSEPLRTPCKAPPEHILSRALLEHLNNMSGGPSLPLRSLS